MLVCHQRWFPDLFIQTVGLSVSKTATAAAAVVPTPALYTTRLGGCGVSTNGVFQAAFIKIVGSRSVKDGSSNPLARLTYIHT